MVGWHHRLNGHKFEQTPGNGEGQGSLAGCSPWDRKVRHDRATEQQQIHYRAFAKFAGYLPPHRGCPDKQGLASGKAPSSLQGSDPLQCPQAGPPSCHAIMVHVVFSSQKGLVLFLPFPYPMHESEKWKWKVKVKSLSPVGLLVTPWTAAHQAPPSMGFSRQEFWSGVPIASFSHITEHDV